MLKKRVLTALILIPLIVVIIFFLPPLTFFSISLLLILLAGWEWAQLAGLTHLLTKFAFLVILAITLLLAVYVPITWVIALGISWWIIAFILLLLYPKVSAWWGNSNTIRAVMGFLVLIPCWVGLIILQGFSPFILMYCLVLIWSVDSAAYFVGRKWGIHKLAPSISPGKSYEGLVGGLLAAAIISGIGLWLLAIPLSSGLLFFILCLFGGGIVSLFGDLFESMLKRQSNIKDSGSILPGHGGILDRIDSLTTSIPFFALVLPFFFNS